MAGLAFNDPKTPEGKYLVKRRDGTIPQWPHFVIAASDPCAPAALRAYAEAAHNQNFDPQFVEDVYALAYDFDKWRQMFGRGDPDAALHRKDDPAIIEEMRKGHSA